MTAPLPLLLAWSGGKDSAWALHVLRQREDFDVVALLTTLTEGFDRASMQGIRREVLQDQADAAGLPLLQSWIPQGCDNTRYEQAFARSLEDAASRWPGLRCMAFGDLLLADIRQWREDLCARLGWRAHFPLFGSDTAVLAREIIDAGVRASLCCIDTNQLDASFAGRAFDFALLDELPAVTDPCGENGEFHTCVQFGPMFGGAIGLRKGETLLRDGRFAYTDFKLAESALDQPSRLGL